MELQWIPTWAPRGFIEDYFSLPRGFILGSLDSLGFIGDPRLNHKWNRRFVYFNIADSQWIHPGFITDL